MRLLFLFIFLVVPAYAGTFQQDNLKSLSLSIANISEQIKNLENEIAETKSRDQRRDKIEELKAKKVKLGSYNNLFFQTAAKVSNDYQEKLHPSEKKQFLDEVQEILSPVFDSLKSANSVPKKIYRLDYENSVYKEQIDKFEQGKNNLLTLKKETNDPDIILQIENTLTSIDKEENDIRILYDSNQELLKQLENKNESFISRADRLFKEFVSEKGFDLFLALLASIITVFFLIFFKRKFFSLKVVQIKLGSWLNPSQLVYDFFAILITLFINFLIFYLRSDIVLLTGYTLILFGIFWSLKQNIPHLIQELSIAFNLGSIHEGEVIVWKNIPWLVSKIGFVCELTNPKLSGTSLKVFARDLVTYHSRPVTASEPWFPSSIGNIVELNDKTFGKVIHQTPESVVLQVLGAAEKHYTLEDYYALHPTNLSLGFNMKCTLSIDYQHQAATQKFLSELQDYLNKNLTEVKIIATEFEKTSESSLDYCVILSCPGQMAENKFAIERQVQRLFIDFCNEHNYVIPFNQLAIHVIK